ncbi:MAG: FliM/FliN family flagellar motor switch protein [Planctomycetota bacterium]|jgi:flagellar motor switch protein FliN/FliY
MAETAVDEKIEEQPQNTTEQDDSKTQAQSVDFPEAAPGTSGTGGSIDILLDMNIPVTVTIGKKEIPVQQLLQLGPGSVLSLDKPVEAPADLYLKDTRFATGTVVVVNGQFAVKINEIIGLGNNPESPAQP